MSLPGPRAPGAGLLGDESPVGCGPSPGPLTCRQRYGGPGFACGLRGASALPGPMLGPQWFLLGLPEAVGVRPLGIVFTIKLGVQGGQRCESGNSLCLC